MGKCINHPNRETSYLCMKQNIYLCEECLQCRDLELYCKFRSSCPIWFLSKRKEKWDAEDKEAATAASGNCRVTFSTPETQGEVPAGATLLEAARLGDVHLNTSCNGKGSCGKCRLVLESGKLDAASTPLLTVSEKEKGYVLACQSRVMEDVTVRIPEEAARRQLKIAGMGREVTEKLKGLVEEIDPMLREVPLELRPPSLEDNVSDLDRLNRSLKKMGCDVTRLNVGIKVMRQLARAVRIDVGTNGEIVLGNNEWLMTAACSAGPAFEGGGIR